MAEAPKMASWGDGVSECWRTGENPEDKTSNHESTKQEKHEKTVDHGGTKSRSLFSLIS
jgi:hypothetical protein